MNTVRSLAGAIAMFVCIALGACDSAPQVHQVSVPRSKRAALEAQREKLSELLRAGVCITCLPTPNLAGVLTAVADRECAIRIDDNPDEVDLSLHIELCPFHLALYDPHGYKGEAASVSYDPATASLHCQIVFLQNGAQPTVGDRASTK